MDEFSIPVDLIASGGGVFEVEIDGVLIYSKRATGSFPHNQEILKTIAKKNPSQ